MARDARAASATTTGRPALGWLLLAALRAVVPRPHLWLTAARQARRMVAPRWWARPPFLPLPDRGYVRFRLVTAYGATGRPEARDLVEYLEWCRRA